jgi:hypothetical protein
MARQGLPDIVDGGGIDAARLGDALDDGLGPRGFMSLYSVSLAIERSCR